MGTTEPQKCASNYSGDVADWTQAFYRLLVEGILTNSSMVVGQGVDWQMLTARLERKAGKKVVMCVMWRGGGRGEGGRSSLRERALIGA